MLITWLLGEIQANGRVEKCLKLNIHIFLLENNISCNGIMTMTFTFIIPNQREGKTVLLTEHFYWLFYLLFFQTGEQTCRFSLVKVVEASTKTCRCDATLCVLLPRWLRGGCKILYAHCMNLLPPNYVSKQDFPLSYGYDWLGGTVWSHQQPTIR